MGLFGSFLKKNITKIEKADTYSEDELMNILNKDNGEKIIEEGAENGNLQCQQLLYTIHMIGAKINKINRDKFEYYTKLAAEQNDSTAQFNHAKNIYDSIEELKSENMENNNGVLIDSLPYIQKKLNESVYWYRKSYENGNKEGLEYVKKIEVNLLKDWIDPLVQEYFE